VRATSRPRAQLRPCAGWALGAGREVSVEEHRTCSSADAVARTRRARMPPARACRGIRRATSSAPTCGCGPARNRPPTMSIRSTDGVQPHDGSMRAAGPAAVRPTLVSASVCTSSSLTHCVSAVVGNAAANRGSLRRRVLRGWAQKSAAERSWHEAVCCAFGGAANSQSTSPLGPGTAGTAICGHRTPAVEVCG